MDKVIRHRVVCGERMDPSPHKVLDIIEHIWPYVAGLFATIIGAVKLGWMERKRTLERIKNVEKLCEMSATKGELSDCRDDVNRQDIEAERRIMDSINKMKESNSDDHLKIINIISNMVSKADDK